MWLHSILFRLLAAGFPLSVLASEDFFSKPDADAFDHGEFGRFPEVTFKSSKLVSPKPLRRTWDPVCDLDEGYYYFFSPYGAANQHPGPMILDHQGHMIWHDEGYPRSYGLDVQEFHGEPVLTWWTGDDSIKGHGIGNYYMLDSTYRPPRKIALQNSLPSDLHEFSIVGNHAIATSFVKTQLNLEAWDKPADGWIWDGVFQEIDLDTNELIFEWRASQHVPFDACMNLDLDGVTFNKNTATADKPWDFYHINSVQKDRRGNYLVSARYCHLQYIDGRTGDVLWYLGGPKNSFMPLDGTVLDFTFQHHARFVDRENAITMFDNRATSVYGHDVPSRGLKFEVDQTAMTVRKVQELIHPRKWYGESQGSMQVLDNGRTLLGFGHSAFFTEFFPDGNVACDIQFAALHHSEDGVQRGGLGQTYRVFKRKWVGKPFYDPKVKFENGNMFVSWNGATEVKWWQLEVSNDWLTFNVYQRARKIQFETSIEIDPLAFAVMRLKALDNSTAILGSWTVWSSGTTQRLAAFDPYTNGELAGHPHTSFGLFFFTFLSGSVSTIAALWWWARRHRPQLLRLRQQRHQSKGRISGEFMSQRTALMHESESDVEKR